MRSGQFEVDTRRPFRAPGEGLSEALGVQDGLLGIYAELPSARRIVALRFPGELLQPDELGRCGIAALVKSKVQLGRGVDISDAVNEGRHLRIAHEWLVRLTLAADERVASLLCEVSVRGGFRGRIPKRLLTQQQIGHITGQTSVNVNRVLASLTQQGLIGRTDKLLTLPGWDDLVRLSGFRAEAFA